MVVGGVNVWPDSTLIDGISTPPAGSNVIECPDPLHRAYQVEVLSAVVVVSLLPPVRDYHQPSKVYPSRIGATGRATCAAFSVGAVTRNGEGAECPPQASKVSTKSFPAAEMQVMTANC